MCVCGCGCVHVCVCVGGNISNLHITKLYTPERCWQFLATPSYVQATDSKCKTWCGSVYMRKSKRCLKKRKKERKAGLLEWSAPEAEISPHQKTTPVWQAAQAIVCDEVFVTLGEQNMSAHPSILAWKGTVGQVVVIISTHGHFSHTSTLCQLQPHTMSIDNLLHTRSCDSWNHTQLSVGFMEKKLWKWDYVK